VYLKFVLKLSNYSTSMLNLSNVKVYCSSQKISFASTLLQHCSQTCDSKYPVTQNITRLSNKFEHRHAAAALCLFVGILDSDCLFKSAPCLITKILLASNIQGFGIFLWHLFTNVLYVRMYKCHSQLLA